MQKGHKQKMLFIKAFIDRSPQLLTAAGDQEKGAIGQVCANYSEIMNEELKEFPDWNKITRLRDECIEIIDNINTYHAIDQIRKSNL